MNVKIAEKAKGKELLDATVDLMIVEVADLQYEANVTTTYILCPVNHRCAPFSFSTSNPRHCSLAAMTSDASRIIHTSHPCA